MQVKLLRLPVAKQFLYVEDLVVFNSKPDGRPDFESWFEVGTRNEDQSDKWLDTLCIEEKFMVLIILHEELERRQAVRHFTEDINLN